MSLFTFSSLSGALSPFSSQDNLVLLPEDSERLSPYRHGYDVEYCSLADSINSFFSPALLSPMQARGGSISPV